MALSDIPILSMLRTRMEWQQARQKVLAENVANADTAGYRPRDLEEPNFEDNLPTPVQQVSLAQTEPDHIAGSFDSSPFASRKQSGYEIRPTGNAVSLEGEMTKLAANQMDYEAVTQLYTKSLQLLNIAIGKG